MNRYFEDTDKVFVSKPSSLHLGNDIEIIVGEDIIDEIEERLRWCPITLLKDRLVELLDKYPDLRANVSIDENSLILYGKIDDHNSISVRPSKVLDFGKVIITVRDRRVKN